jgi:hypothetical protein
MEIKQIDVAGNGKGMLSASILHASGIPGNGIWFFLKKTTLDLRFLHHGGNVAGFNSLAVPHPGNECGFLFCIAT